MQTLRMNNRLNFASLPSTFKDMTLVTFRSDVYKKTESKQAIAIAVRVIKEYLSDIETNLSDGMGLYIYSKTKGSGKTRLVTSIANDLMKNHSIQVKFASSPQIINEIRRTWDRDSEYSENKLLDALSTTQVLIIDDFGTEQVKGWVNDKFYSIINQRYINKKTTILTSNSPLEELDYDDRIISRIRERVYQISFPEEDIRGYIAEERNKEMLNKIMEGRNGV